jgi:hypothetical protein
LNGSNKTKNEHELASFATNHVAREPEQVALAELKGWAGVAVAKTMAV